MRFKIEEIARVAHEVNRAYCQSIGDQTQVPWTEAPEWQKKSAADGVAYFLGNPDKTPAEGHANWFKQKLSEGWGWGREKDPENKRHPCMCPYEALPREQRTKDHIFRAVVLTLGNLPGDCC